ncbi:hypothetical protein AB0904_25190, partial [Streptomyces sp. NPDC006684]|uniref:hypothetical protein n=1 Tax=Streptomyces sp. NPDC006684 TaxID=3154477 RepID=UPI003452667B
IGAFNLGNALAAWLGGLVIDAGFGYTSPNWVVSAPPGHPRPRQDSTSERSPPHSVWNVPSRSTRW